MSWDDLDGRHYDRPTLQKTQRYKDKVFEIVNEVMQQLAMTLPILEEFSWWVLLDRN